MSLPENFRADREAITAALQRRRYRLRRGAEETWWDGRCLFHDDAHSSASWQPDTGLYYCRTEDRSFLVPVVLAELSLPAGQRRRARLHPSRPDPSHVQENPTTVANQPVDVYAYFFPDGTLSHRKYRQGDGKAKRIWQEGPQGERNLPETIWPIYGDQDVGSGQNLILVEGEKLVDAVLVANDTYNGQPIRALTCGSVADLRKHAQALAQQVAELEPANLLLWPDFDEPGARAMQDVSRALRLTTSLQFQVLKPADYRLPLAGDVIDFLEAGGSLAGLFADQFGGGSRSQDLVAETVCTDTMQFIFPGTRKLVRIDTSYIQALALNQLGYVPADKETKELTARLRRKALLEPVKVHHRVYRTRQAVWWRPESTGRAYQIDAQGVTLVDDPPDGFLAVPSEEPDWPVTVDLGGTRQDLEELCSAFHLGETEVAMVEGWLTCALLGVETPILLIKGPAGTGKTTLARLLAAVLEPMVPEVDASADHQRDIRQFLRALEHSPIVLLDNVSRILPGLEDVLAKLVTGYTSELRTLYEDSTSIVKLRRPVLITTISWDVFKGDLATRMVVVQPSTDSSFAWLADSQAHERFAPFLPKIRGHVFHAAQTFLARVPSANGRVPFRIGDLGVVLHSLGYDVADLAQKEATAKSQVMNLYNLWLDAFVELWQEEDSVSFSKPTKELVQWMRDYGITEPPADRSPKFARWIAETAPIFRDHGFSVEPYRTKDFRGYKFSRVSAQDYQTAMATE